MVPAADHQQRMFDNIGSDACERLFGDYGVKLTREPEPVAAQSPDFPYFSVLGFWGQKIRGSVVLAATSEVLEDSNPLQQARRDWMGELANQLFGRMKLELGRREVQVSANIPAVMRGEHLA